MSRWRATRPGRGLRARLIIGFVSVSAVTAALTVLAMVLIRLIVANYYGKHFLFVALPAHMSRSLVDVVSGAVGLIVLMIATAAALLAAHTVLRPVGQLAQAAGRVASGDLDVRLVPEGHDELSSLVATFNAMTAQVEESVEELRRMESNAQRFASDVSHELRSPLAAMTAVTEILEDRSATMDVEEARATALVIEGITRLGRLVEDLLEISRFDAGTVMLDQETVRVADAVDACLKLREWTDRVSVDVPACLMVTADRRRLDVILANLIGNALKHGAAPFEVRADVVLDGLQGKLRVTVRDHGPGLASEALTAVFDRFYKAEAARSPSDGSGLGLAIALENARLHGGSITAANAPGAGATFTLTLPRHSESTTSDDTEHKTAVAVALAHRYAEPRGVNRDPRRPGDGARRRRHVPRDSLTESLRAPRPRHDDARDNSGSAGSPRCCSQAPSVGLCLRLDVGRAARTREEKRRRCAAHLHDSVLQTLALIQHRTVDPSPSPGSRDARSDPLRAWMAGEAGLTSATVATVARDRLSEVEEENGGYCKLQLTSRHEVTLWAARPRAHPRRGGPVGRDY